MADYFIVADRLFPLSSEDAGRLAFGLGRGLTAHGHGVTALSLASPAACAAVPGLARRLRPVLVDQGGTKREFTLFEGRPSQSTAQVYVLAADASDLLDCAALLAGATASLVRDEIVKPQIVVGWGEASAAALGEVPAAFKFFALPEGAPVSAVLAAAGTLASDALVTTSATAARVIEADPATGARASDQPILVARMGCDEPPNDPGSDPSLAQVFSAQAPSGKRECRKALARRLALSLGPQTLLCATGPLHHGNGGREIVAALPKLVGLDIVVALSGHGDPALLDQARVVAIEHPGRIAVHPDGGEDARRQILAGADALWLAGGEDLTGRAAGLGLRYGALPVVPASGAFADFLVDFDAGSATGNALLFAPGDEFEMVGALRRAIALRAEVDQWNAVVVTLMRTAPIWADPAGRLHLATESAAASVRAA